MKPAALLQKAADLWQYQLQLRERVLRLQRQQIRLEQEAEALRQRRQARATETAPRPAARERPAEATVRPCSRIALATPLIKSPVLSWWQGGQPFTVWQLKFPSRFPAFLNGVAVQRWLVPPDTSFAGGDVLCELRFTPNRRQRNPRWQDCLLKAPQDGYLLGAEHPAGPVGSKESLGFFIPLPEWQAFIALLDRQEAAIARYRQEERRRAGLLRELAEHRRCRPRTALPGRADSAATPSGAELEAALTRLTARLRQCNREAAAALAPHRAWLHERRLAECCALLLGGAADGREPALLDQLSARERTGLERVLERFLAERVPFSAAELRRLQPLLRQLDAVQARFTAIDREVREAVGSGGLSAAQEEAFSCRQEEVVSAVYREITRP